MCLPPMPAGSTQELKLRAEDEGDCPCDQAQVRPGVLVEPNADYPRSWILPGSQMSSFARSRASPMHEARASSSPSLGQADEPIPAPKGRGSRTPSLFSCKKRCTLEGQRWGHDAVGGPLWPARP